ILNREHVCKIMEQIGEAKYVLQKDLGEKLALKPANLTRILNQLEDWELISRHKVGREKYLTFGPRALDYFPDAGREKRIAAAAAGQNSSSKEMGGIQDVFKSPFPNVVVVDFKSAA
ncbi:MAG TPA: MarR family transcriptional regulator, partial [Magnetococcales bacterium]|nr:MarR family transcriptional regulator [Magnetococcales bacterium]